MKKEPSRPKPATPPPADNRFVAGPGSLIVVSAPPGPPVRPGPAKGRPPWMNPE